VKRHEDLTRSNDAGDSQLDVLYAAAARGDGDPIMRLKRICAASAGFISSHAFGTMSCSRATCAVLVASIALLDLEEQQAQVMRVAPSTAASLTTPMNPLLY